METTTTQGLGFMIRCRPLINEPPVLNMGCNRDPNIPALKKGGGLLIRGLHKVSQVWGLGSLRSVRFWAWGLRSNPMIQCEEDWRSRVWEIDDACDFGRGPIGCGR